MTQKRAPSAGYAVQGVLLLMFFVALSIFATWFFLQRNWWLPEVASIHGANLDPEFLITLAITGFMFIVLQVCLGVLALKFAENGKKRHRPQSRLFEKRFAIGAASFVFLVDISLFLMGESSFRAAMGGITGKRGDCGSDGRTLRMEFPLSGTRRRFRKDRCPAGGPAV